MFADRMRWLGFMIDHPRVQKWITQFDPSDRPGARLFLRSLELVSFEEFETSIVNSLEMICSTEAGRIAAFPVDPNFNLTFLNQYRAKRRLMDLRMRRVSPQ